MGALVMLVLACGAAALAVAGMLLADPSSPRRARRSVPAPTPGRAVEVVRADYRRLFRRGRVATRAFWQMRVAPGWHDAQTWCRALAERVRSQTRQRLTSATGSWGGNDLPSGVEEPPSACDEQQVA